MREHVSVCYGVQVSCYHLNCVCCHLIARHFQCMFCVIVIAWCERVLRRYVDGTLADVCWSKVAFFKAFLPTPSQVVCHFGKTSSHGVFHCFLSRQLYFLGSSCVGVWVWGEGEVVTVCVCVLTVYACAQVCVYIARVVHKFHLCQHVRRWKTLINNTLIVRFTGGNLSI